jgi:hypothetical protein
MRTTEATQLDISHTALLAGNIVLAGVDVTSLLEYGLRIALGAVVLSGMNSAKGFLQRRKKKKEADNRLNRIRNRKSKNSANGIGE